ncbi:MAG: hypothetical protein AW07_04693 [Candidatus Accumulibacter sp. SK-11]|nr:MAG: hypothetical protein AW07_04693 [Candidatus Accumulibacter sp. SK-11]
MSELQQDFHGDPQVSALYREHAHDEPSAAVDERILAAARAAVSAPAAAAGRTWWQRWRTTLALGTTLVLTLTLSLLHERQSGDVRRDAEVAPPRPLAPGGSPAALSRDGAAPAAAPPADTGDAAAAAGTTPSAVAPRPQAREERFGGQRAAPPAGESGQRPAAGEPSRQSSGAAVDRAAPAAAVPSPAVAKASDAVPAVAPLAPAAAIAGQEAGATGQAAARAKETPALRGEGARSAGDWLEEIRALRREGRAAEAAKQLADFRRAHPDYALPDDFRH